MAVATSSPIKKQLVAIINNPHSSATKVRNAFAYLYREEERETDEDFIECVNALYQHHPRIAEEFSTIIPERLIPKNYEWAV